MTPELEQEKTSIEKLLAGIHYCYGYDFTHYSYASLKRRLSRALEQAKLNNFGELLRALCDDERQFEIFLRHMSVTVTDMFRDPLFYKTVRTVIIPVLKTYPFIKIWHAGCATGEEVYSLAILLHEEGFLDRARIYATDFNKHSLSVAEQGIYSGRRMAEYRNNYAHAGGERDFNLYYSDAYERAKIAGFLKERVIFSYHNLVTDGVFGEMNLILCRNVLIYFDRELQNRVLTLFSQSLRYGGFLCLGNKESLRFTSVEDSFEAIDFSQRIYKKCGEAYV